MHRGAVGGDSQTGDGAGILVQIPDEFFRKSVLGLPARGGYAVGMLFLPADIQLAQKCRQIIEDVAAEENMRVFTWRSVPVNLSAIGGMALESCPRIEQVFILPNSPYADSADFERALYVLRRQIEKRVDAETSAETLFTSARFRAGQSFTRGF